MYAIVSDYTADGKWHRHVHDEWGTYPDEATAAERLAELREFEDVGESSCSVLRVAEVEDAT